MSDEEFGSLVCRSAHHCRVYDCDCHDDSCYEDGEQK
jgi:hypothetical protein